MCAEQHRGGNWRGNTGTTSVSTDPTRLSQKRLTWGRLQMWLRPRTSTTASCRCYRRLPFALACFLWSLLPRRQRQRLRTTDRPGVGLAACLSCLDPMSTRFGSRADHLAEFASAPLLWPGPINGLASVVLAPLTPDRGGIVKGPGGRRGAPLA